MTPGSTYRLATLQPPCLGHEPRLGLRHWVPSQASRRAALHISSFSRVVSKYVAVLGGAEVHPQTVNTSEEWSEIFLMDGAASILPPLESSSWETRNLSIWETVDP
jgi:hypothetical protein